MKFNLLLILLFSSSLFAQDKCYLKLHPVIVKTDSSFQSNIIQDSDCPEMVSSSLVTNLNMYQGKIKSSILAEQFSNEKIKVQIVPDSIQVIDFTTLISPVLSNGVTLEKAETVSQRTIVANSISDINIHCDHCDAEGNRDIRIMAGPTVYWLRLSLVTEHNAYVLTSSVDIQMPLESNKIKMVKQKYGRPIKLFTDVENLKYYRLTRSLAAGTVLEEKHFSAKKLIQPNQRIRLLVNNKGVVIKSYAKSKTSGKFGQHIELYNPVSKKIFTAKVIDFNTAVVEL